VTGLVLILREGLVPARFAPLPRFELEASPKRITDWQLASLRNDPVTCRRLMKSPDLIATPAADRPFKDGCGVVNAARVERVAGAQLALGGVRCELAAALTVWMKHDVQPLATKILGQQVREVEHLGGFACRNVTTKNPLLKGLRSEHASGGAIDITGFKLADGRTISVNRNWADKGKEGEFLRAIHARACNIFRVVIGPGTEYRDHLHLDRGPFWACQ
jgi:hypothetical protein